MSLLTKIGVVVFRLTSPLHASAMNTQMHCCVVKRNMVVWRTATDLDDLLLLQLFELQFRFGVFYLVLLIKFKICNLIWTKHICIFDIDIIKLAVMFNLKVCTSHGVAYITGGIFLFCYSSIIGFTQVCVFGDELQNHHQIGKKSAFLLLLIYLRHFNFTNVQLHVKQCNQTRSKYIHAFI